MWIKDFLAELPPVPEGFAEKLPNQEEGDQEEVVGTLPVELRRLFSFIITERQSLQTQVLVDYLNSLDITNIGRTTAQRLAMRLQKLKTLEMNFATEIRQLFLDQVGFDQELQIQKGWVVTRKPMDPTGEPSLLFRELGFDVNGDIILKEESQPTVPGTD